MIILEEKNEIINLLKNMLKESQEELKRMNEQKLKELKCIANNDPIDQLKYMYETMNVLKELKPTTDKSMNYILEILKESNFNTLYNCYFCDVPIMEIKDDPLSKNSNKVFQCPSCKRKFW